MHEGGNSLKWLRKEWRGNGRRCLSVDVASGMSAGQWAVYTCCVYAASLALREAPFHLAKLPCCCLTPKQLICLLHKRLCLFKCFNLQFYWAVVPSWQREGTAKWISFTVIFKIFWREDGYHLLRWVIVAQAKLPVYLQQLWKVCVCAVGMCVCMYMLVYAFISMLRLPASDLRAGFIPQLPQGSSFLIALKSP